MIEEWFLTCLEIGIKISNKIYIYFEGLKLQ